MIVRVLILVLMAGSVFAQQEKPVFGFFGGLVNSISNSGMKDDQALVLEDFDVDDFGNLRPRQGFQIHYPDDTSGGATLALVPFFDGLDKKLFVIRTRATPAGSVYDSLLVVTVCDDTIPSCTTIVYEGVFPGRRDLSYPYNVDYSVLSEVLSIAQTGSELLLWQKDSSYMYPARPVAPAQPKAIALNGSGNITGRLRYRLAYKDNADDSISNLSPPSYPITVTAADVVVTWNDEVPTEAESLLVYRETNSSGYFTRIATLDTPSVAYYDTNSAPAIDTPVNRWGNTQRARPQPVEPPGGMAVSLDTCTTASYGVGAELILTTFTTNEIVDSTFVGYMVTFTDVNGLVTFVSPPVWSLVSTVSDPADGDGSKEVDTSYWAYRASLTNLPIPYDSGIVTKTLYRCYSIPTLDWYDDGISAWGSLYDTVYNAGTWFEVADLDPDSTTHTDSIPYADIATEVFCTPTDTPTVTVDSIGGSGPDGYRYAHTDSGDYFLITGTHIGELASLECAPDSVLSIQPSAITASGSRIYAVGNQAALNQLHYSSFGAPYKWASDNFFATPTETGDWWNGLVSLSTDAMLLFRQNSLWSLTGTNFYQYNFDRVLWGVGLSAPRTLSRSFNQTFFVHESGVYTYPSSDPVTPLSAPIQNTVDSLRDKIQRSFGKVIEDEYWWSVPMTGETNDRTYIYALSPQPHWKCYTRGLFDAVQFNYDTTVQDFRSERWIVILDNDSLYRWNYEDSVYYDSGNDSLIEPTYQSKYFFEGGGRERIMYVDLFGSGDLDSLQLIFYENYGEGLPGTPFDSQVVAIDWSDAKRDRVRVDRICENFSLKIHAYQSGNWTLRGYTIGFEPWDRGRR